MEQKRFESVFDIARDTVLQFINEKEKFTKTDLHRAIRNAGGVMVVAPGCTVKDFIDNFEYKGVLEYIPKEDAYEVLV